MTGAPRTARERVLHSRVQVAWPKVEVASNQPRTVPPRRVI